MTDYEQKEYDQAVSQMRGMLSQAEVDALWAQGQALTLEQAIRFAREENV